MTQLPLFVPVILGTPRQGRQSEAVTKFVAKQVSARADIETKSIDIRTLPLAPMTREKPLKI